MYRLPNDTAMLVSSINMLLRDEEFDTLESLCYCYNEDPQQLKERLHAEGYVYSTQQRQFRPEGYDNAAITRNGIEQAFCLMHQKLRVYEHSNMEWQKDDIEWAIGDFVSSMSPILYNHIAQGKERFLLDHTDFAADLQAAVDRLERMLNEDS